MYRIIGGDGKEYGPVSAEVLRQWLAERRVNGQTRTRLDSASEWKVLNDFPELATIAPLGTVPPQWPLLTTFEADALAREILGRDYQLDIGRCISRGWDLVLRNFWPSVGAAVLVWLLVKAVAFIPFGSLFLTYVLYGGLDWMFLRLARGERAELGDAFAGFNLAFLPLMLFSLVAQLLTVLGFFFCILPGIYLFVAWLLFGPLLILDKHLDFWPAMELSRKIVSRHWWQVFGFCLLCLVIYFGGVLLCGVGYFIALPVVQAAKVYAYEDIFGSRSAPARPERGL
jgi:hypothetical protein